MIVNTAYDQYFFPIKKIIESIALPGLVSKHTYLNICLEVNKNCNLLFCFYLDDILEVSPAKFGNDNFNKIGGGFVS